MLPHQIAGRRIADMRDLHRMTQVEFGEQMARYGYPMSRATVWKVEQGKRPLTLDELFAAAHVLHTSPLMLLEPLNDESLHVGGATPEATIVLELDGESLAAWWVHRHLPEADTDAQKFFGDQPPIALDALQKEWNDLAMDRAVQEGRLVQAVMEGRSKDVIVRHAKALAAFYDADDVPGRKGER